MKFIAIQECADGNESVGSMWLRVANFDPKTPIGEVWKWSLAGNHAGRLIIRMDENDNGSTFRDAALRKFTG